MRAFLGLTRKTIDEVNELTIAMLQLGVDPQEPPEGLLNEREKMLLRMTRHLREHPEDNLWNQHPDTL
jgi:hypothetical protein